MATLATIRPIDPANSRRTELNVSSADRPDVCSALDGRWMPAMLEEPVINVQFFDGDFSSNIEPGSATIGLSLDALEQLSNEPNLLSFLWANAPVELFRYDDGAVESLAVMQVSDFALEDWGISLRLQVDTEPFEIDVLSEEYEGTGNIEGSSDMAGRPKPWAFGRARNVPAVFIDPVDNVFQVSAYGAISEIDAVFENGASFGPSFGNYANYTSLLAAAIPPGRWATCHALGLFRLGAPPFGVITCDLTGDSVGGVARKTGEVLLSIAERLGVLDQVDLASFRALDEAVPFDIDIWISEQTTLLALAQRLASPCNAVAGVGLDGKLRVLRVVLGEEQMTLDVQGRQLPAVLGSARQKTSAPYKRIQFGAARSWRVHSLDEIAAEFNLVERGDHDLTTTYREGNIVNGPAGTRWLYTNIVATSGNPLPVWPETSNDWWQNIKAPTDVTELGIEEGATRGAPAGTDVAGVPATQIVTDVQQANTNAAQAALDANDALDALDDISEDDWFSAPEKEQVRVLWTAANDERLGIRAEAIALGLSVVSYQNAFDALETWATSTVSLFNGQGETINRATFRNAFTNYYLARQSLLNDIAEEAARRAEWDSVTGSDKPEDNADRTRGISGPPTIYLSYRSEGQLLTLLPVRRDYQLREVNAGTYSTGVTWGVTVHRGEFAGSDPSISGTLRGELSINSELETDEAVLWITAEIAGYDNLPRCEVIVRRNVQFPNETKLGGPGELTTIVASDHELDQISSSASWQNISDELLVTAPSGTGGFFLRAANLAFSVGQSTVVGSTTYEIKWQRKISDVWTDIGLSFFVSPEIDEFGGAVIDESRIMPGGTLSQSLVAGSTQEFRLQGRRSSGITRSASIHGSIYIWSQGVA